jgi:hypothetical protein
MAAQLQLHMSILMSCSYPTCHTAEKSVINAVDNKEDHKEITAIET